MRRGGADEFGAPHIAAQLLAHCQRPAGIARTKEPCGLELPILDRSRLGLARLMSTAEEGDVSRAPGADAILAERAKPMRHLEIFVVTATPPLGARSGHGQPGHCERTRQPHHHPFFWHLLNLLASRRGTRPAISGSILPPWRREDGQALVPVAFGPWRHPPVR